MEPIVFQTNLYATQKGQRFIPTRVPEIFVFLGIDLLMEIKGLPSYDYWLTFALLSDNYILKYMSIYI